MVQPEIHTFLNSLDRDEETLWRCLIFTVTEEKVETIMTFEPTECSVFIQQAVHLHIILCKVLTCVQFSESSFCLHTLSYMRHINMFSKALFKKKKKSLSVYHLECYMKLTLSCRRPNLGLALRT